MIVSVHQPCYMPWLGYLQRMAQADVFVLLDHVQFERANFQNRTRIRMHSGSPRGPDYEARWLTVPVVQRSQKERIVEKEIDNGAAGPRLWSAIHFATLRHAYREAAYFNLYMPALEELLEARWHRLVDLNQAMLELLRDAFGIRTPLVRSSELGVQGAKSALVLEICRALGADRFLGGMGGSRAYLDREAFARADIAVAWQEFRHPVYAQCGSAPFMAGLSSLDLLLNCGPQGRHLFLADEPPRELRAAA
jgi:hypothetical protein